MMFFLHFFITRLWAREVSHLWVCAGVGMCLRTHQRAFRSPFGNLRGMRLGKGAKDSLWEYRNVVCCYQR